MGVHYSKFSLFDGAIDVEAPEESGFLVMAVSCHRAARPEIVPKHLLRCGFLAIRTCRTRRAVNVLTAEEPTDWGGGSGFYDAFVEVALAAAT
jgi:hypothetical protein